MSNIVERPGAITFKGSPMTLVGPELKVGDHAPDFVVSTTSLAPMTWDDLSNHGQKAVLMILVPSIDTSVCSLETGKFNRHVASLPADRIKVVTITADTPFAQKRWPSRSRSLILRCCLIIKSGLSGMLTASE